MVSFFTRSLRAIDRDRFRRNGWWLVATLLLLVVWGWWFFLSDVGVYIQSDHARVEVAQQTIQLQSLVSGRVITTHTTLGSRVTKGDVIVELDAETQRQQLKEEEQRLQSLFRQIQISRNQLTTQQSILSEHRAGKKAERSEAEARLRKAVIAMQLAKEEAARASLLDQSNSIAKAEVERAVSKAQEAEANVEALQNEVDQTTAAHRAQTSIDRQKIDELYREIALLEGEVAEANERVIALNQAIDHHFIYAPSDGHIGEFSGIHPGRVVQSGEPLGTVVPDGELKVTAYFQPAKALGRAKIGQQGLIRFAGFPWTEYGMVPATVTTLTTEIQEEGYRVELALDSKHQNRIPLQHGLPGSVEIEVERVSPATLVLRTVGMNL